MSTWSDWLPFPDPRKGDHLAVPFGAGCYELRRRDTRQLVLFGSSGHVAARMTSLLPQPLGRGTRNNSQKRRYVLENLAMLDYRTAACQDREAALSLERELRTQAHLYLFRT
jgi:hypothetical protein